MKSKNMIEDNGDDGQEIGEHEVHAAAQDLMRAESHKNNPKMMNLVQKHLAKQKQQISSIQDLKKARNNMMTGQDDSGFADEEPAPKMPKMKMEK